MVVDDGPNRRAQRLLAQIPLGTPGELLVRQVGQLRHARQAEVAGLRQDGGVEMLFEGARARLTPARMHEVVAEVGQRIDLDHQIHQLRQRERRSHPLLHGAHPLGQLFRAQGRDDEFMVLHAHLRIPRVPRQRRCELREQHVQLVLALRQPLLPTRGCVHLAADFGAQLAPALARDQIGLGVSIAAAVLQPEVTRPQGGAQVHQHAQLVVMPVDLARRQHHIGAPLGRDKVERRVLRDLALGEMVELTHKRQGVQQRIVGVMRAEGQRVEELRGELAQVAVALRQEIEVVVVEGPHQALRLVQLDLQAVGGNLAQDVGTHLGIRDRGVEHRARQRVEKRHLGVGRAGSCAAELFQIVAGARVGVGQAVVE